MRSTGLHVVPVDLSDSARKGFGSFTRLQLPEGHWAGESGGPSFLLPGLVSAMYLAEMPLPDDCKTEMLRFLENHANQHGERGFHLESHSTVARHRNNTAPSDTNHSVSPWLLFVFFLVNLWFRYFRPGWCQKKANRKVSELMDREEALEGVFARSWYERRGNNKNKNKKTKRTEKNHQGLTLSGRRKTCYRLIGYPNHRGILFP